MRGSPRWWIECWHFIEWRRWRRRSSHSCALAAVHSRLCVSLRTKTCENEKLLVIRRIHSLRFYFMFFFVCLPLLSSVSRLLPHSLLSRLRRGVLGDETCVFLKLFSPASAWNNIELRKKISNLHLSPLCHVSKIFLENLTLRAIFKNFISLIINNKCGIYLPFLVGLLYLTLNGKMFWIVWKSWVSVESLFGSFFKHHTKHSPRRSGILDTKVLHCKQ